MSREKTALRPCPICAETQVDVLHAQRFLLPEGHPLANGYDVVCCLACGFVFADVMVTQTEYDVFYRTQSKYEAPKISSGSGETETDRQRLGEAAGLIARQIGNPEKRVLDMGCANGGLLSHLQALGFQNLVGVDPSPACVENTSRRGIQAWPGSLYQLPAEIGQFDAVLLSHVLEHLQDLSQAVLLLKSLLKPGGVLYIEVPDATRYADYLLAPFQEFNVEHINHFSEQALANLFAAQGFEVMAAGARLVYSAPGKPYPVLHMFLSLPDAHPPFTYQKDVLLVERIRAYIDQSSLIWQQLDRRLQAILAHASGLVVWGTGQLAAKLLVETCLAYAPILAFIDSDPVNQGRKLKGIPILAPGQAQGYADYPILIASLLHEKAITRTIREELHLKNEIIYLQAPG